MKLPYTNEGKNRKSVLIEDSGTLKHSMIARSFVCDHGMPAVEIANLSNDEVVLKTSDSSLDVVKKCRRYED